MSLAGDAAPLPRRSPAPEALPINAVAPVEKPMPMASIRKKIGKGQREGRQGIGGVTAGPECIHHVVQRVEQKSHRGGNRQSRGSAGESARWSGRCPMRRSAPLRDSGRLAVVSLNRTLLGPLVTETVQFRLDFRATAVKKLSTMPQAQVLTSGSILTGLLRPNRRARVGSKHQIPKSPPPGRRSRNTESCRQEPQSRWPPPP